MKCERCGQTDFKFVSKDDIFTVYVCTYCHQQTYIQNPTCEFTKADLEACFLRQSKNFDRLQQENQLTYRRQEISANNRHFETRLDHLRSDLRNIEVHSTDTHYLEKKRSVLFDIYELFEKHYADLIQIIQTTTDLSEIKGTIESILLNIDSQFDLVLRLHTAEINVQALRKSLKSRKDTMWSFLISTEYKIAIKDFRILSTIPNDNSNLQIWEEYKQKLINENKILTTYRARDEVKEKIQIDFKTNIVAAENRCHVLRQQLLKKRLRTNLYSDLPDSLGELGREFDLINRDLEFVTKMMPQKEAREYRDDLIIRKIRVLCKIIFKSTIMKLRSK